MNTFFLRDRLVLFCFNNSMWRAAKQTTIWEALLNRSMKAMAEWINPFANVLFNIKRHTGFIVKWPVPSCALSYNTLLCSYLAFIDSRPLVADLLARCSLLTIYCNSLVKPLFNTGLLPSCPAIQPGLLRLLYWTTILCLIDMRIIYTLIPAAIPNDSQPLYSALTSPCQLVRRLSVCVPLIPFQNSSSLCITEDDGADS